MHGLATVESFSTTATAVPLASSVTVGCVVSSLRRLLLGGAHLACLLTVSRACHILDAMDFFKSSGSGWLSLYVTKESLDSWRVSDLIPSTTVESPTLARYILSFLMMHTVAVVPAVLGFQVVSIKGWRKIHS